MIICHALSFYDKKISAHHDDSLHHDDGDDHAKPSDTLYVAERRGEIGFSMAAFVTSLYREAC